MTSQFVLTSRSHFQIQDLTQLALDYDLEWATADLAISNKPLLLAARVHHQVKALATVWALNWFAHFHVEGALGLFHLPPAGHHAGVEISRNNTLRRIQV